MGFFILNSGYYRFEGLGFIARIPTPKRVGHGSCLNFFHKKWERQGVVNRDREGEEAAGTERRTPAGKIEGDSHNNPSPTHTGNAPMQNVNRTSHCQDLLRNPPQQYFKAKICTKLLPKHKNKKVQN